MTSVYTIPFHPLSEDERSHLPNHVSECYQTLTENLKSQNAGIKTRRSLSVKVANRLILCPNLLHLNIIDGR